MTVTYGGNFFKALFRWRGSVWKTVWKELLVWLFFYYLLRLIFYQFRNTSHDNMIKGVVELFEAYTTRLPLEFLLGFYVTQVVNRWWAQVSALPWPDEVLAHACSVLHQDDEDTMSRRRSVGRYLIVSLILAYKNISSSILKMFPTIEKLQQCNLLTAEEREIIENAGYPDIQYEIPLQWIHEVVRSKVDSTQGSLVFALNSVRNNIRNLIHYNAISFPLVYTQTVTVAVYGYFTFCLIGHQILHSAEVDMIFPFLTVLRFIFGVGWLKVAEDLGKPFGSDDDDVELIIWLQRHIRLVFTVTDYAVVRQPKLSWESDQSCLVKAITLCHNDTKPLQKKKPKRKTLERFKSVVLPFTSPNVVPKDF